MALTPISQPAIIKPTSIGSKSSVDLDGPDSIDTKSVSNISGPTPITPSLSAIAGVPIIIAGEVAPIPSVPILLTPSIAVLADVPPFPLRNARILYDNELIASTANSAGGTGASLTLSPNTADRWESSVSDSITYTLNSQTEIDTVCIGAHNISDGGYTLTVQYRVTALSSLITIGTVTPTDNKSIMIHLDSAINATVVLVKVTGGSGDVYIGSVYAGIALQMQRPFFAGFTPAHRNAVTDYFTNTSETGELIGRSIRRRAYKTSFDWKYITDIWYRTYFQPFVESAKRRPFYVAWNLLEYPLDVAYGYTTDDISAPYSGIRKFVSINFDMLVHG